MPILNIQSSQAGLTGVLPALAYINTNDTEAQVLAAGYLNQAVRSGLASFSSPCMCCVTTVSSLGAQPDVGWYELSYSAGNWSLTTTATPGAQDSTSSATPGTIRAFTGKMVSTASVVTSGNLVGVRGELDMVGASGGFFYGEQGKVIATGTLSGSSWTAGVFGQFDVHAATINGGQLATVWGDWGATGATATSMVGARGFAFTNTTANILNAQFYMYGPATNLLELDDNSGAYGASYITSGGSGGLSGTIKKLAISINGVAYYIPCATVVS